MARVVGCRDAVPEGRDQRGGVLLVAHVDADRSVRCGVDGVDTGTLASDSDFAVTPAASANARCQWLSVDCGTPCSRAASLCPSASASATISARSFARGVFALVLGRGPGFRGPSRGSLDARATAAQHASHVSLSTTQGGVA
jgi:hypothetical protein